MSSVITTDFEKWKAQQVAVGKSVILDEFVFANVPGLDPAQAIRRDEKLPAANYIVHRQAVNKTGLASENSVAYSVTLGTEVGDFEFNWIGLINKASGVIGMITHAPIQKKIKTANGLQGNVLTRSFLLEFDGAAKETAITTTAETWQIDFTARLSGIDEMQRLINTDSYGEAAFFGDGFAVVHQGEQYLVKKGLAYVGGLRGVLEFDQTLNSLRNTRVYADFSYQGNLVSQWQTVVKITVANELKNYLDAAGNPHYVFAVAQIDGGGDIVDLRPTGSSNDRDIEALNGELGRVKQDYATNAALKTVNDNAYSKTGGVVDGSVSAEGEITGNNIVRARSNLSTVEINASESSPKLTSRQGNGGWNSAYIPQKNGTIAFLDDIPAPITPTTIAQSTGQSTTSIMSQQATTRVLETKFSKSGGNIDGFVSVAGEITGTNIVRARGSVSVIELNASYPQPQLTSRTGNNAWFNARIPQKNGTIAFLDDIPVPTRIAQSTGTATDVVMSQKSVTDAISAHGVGYAQSWVHVTTSRVIGAWYVNDTNRPLFVVIAVSRDTREGTEQSAANISFKQGGDVIHIPLVRGANSGGAQRGTGSAIIPVGAAYSVTTEFDNKITNWWELR
ncbi:phage tail protein [Xenorhabdus sp. SF857]|uniref:phage tail-collar fiber domain-containing protein n=1 Tax=Xenorhabdus bakwenae TaxID=3026967 RepID=UPI0025580725|nr:phage tail protein [Xenorhabdus sp. SF857]WFQ78520.1 phage tail protein [Xenorhabdus sp. SF857]